MSDSHCPPVSFRLTHIVVAMLSLRSGLASVACRAGEGAPGGPNPISAESNRASAPRFELVELWRGRRDVDYDFGDAAPSAIGDLDSDGVEELLVPQPNPSLGGSGIVRIQSGATGQVVFEVSRRTDGFGRDAVRVRDCDGDGRDDVSIAMGWLAPLDSTGPYGAMLFGSRSSEPVQDWRGDCLFAARMLGLDDLDGDGAGECALLTYGWGHHELELRSSRSGAEIAWPADERLHAHALDSLLASLGDIDRDGTSDFTFATTEGQLVLISGATLRPRWTRSTHEDDWVLVDPLIEIGDLDGDGFTDLAAPEWLTRGPAAGALRLVVISGRDGQTVRHRGLEAKQADQLALTALGDVDDDGVSELGYAFDVSAIEREFVVLSLANDAELLRECLKCSRSLVTLHSLDGRVRLAAEGCGGELKAFEIRRRLP